MADVRAKLYRAWLYGVRDGLRSDYVSEPSWTRDDGDLRMAYGLGLQAAEDVRNGGLYVKSQVRSLRYNVVRLVSLGRSP